MAERSFLRRLLLCPMGLCQTFRAAYDDKAMWGECSLCGRRSGEVSREALRGCLKVAGPLESDWRSAEVEPVTPCQEDSLTCYLPQHVFAAMKADLRDPRLFYPSIARWIESHPAGHMQTLPLVEVEVRVRRVIERGERP